MLDPDNALVGLTLAVTTVPGPDPDPAQAVGVSAVDDCFHTFEPSSATTDQPPPLPVSHTLWVGCSKSSEKSRAACAGALEMTVTAASRAQVAMKAAGIARRGNDFMAAPIRRRNEACTYSRNPAAQMGGPGPCWTKLDTAAPPHRHTDAHRVPGSRDVAPVDNVIRAGQAAPQGTMVSCPSVAIGSSAMRR